MRIADLGTVQINYREDGDPDGAPVVFANSLGTDYRLWDPVVPLLPQGLRIVRYDKRGHGLSVCPPPPYSMDSLVTDAECLLDHLGIKECLFVGLSIGGMTAQALAAKRPDLVRAMVISNTAAKIGTQDIWQDRMDTAQRGGLEELADGVMERWFSKEFRASPDLLTWRNMLVRQPLDGYIGCSAAIRDTDLYSQTGGLTLPTLAIAGNVDGSTPADMVRETADLIKGSRFHLIRGTGHLPCVEKPKEYARILSEFIKETGYA